MAKIRKQVLGRISGAIGDVLFRVKNGKGFVGTRPISFMPGTDTKSVNRRSKFAVANKYAKAVNIIVVLKQLWKQYKTPVQSAYNYIMKKNYHNVTPDDVSDNLMLVPEVGFNVTVTETTVSGNEIKVTIEAIGENAGIDPVTETKLQLALVAFYKNPTNDNYSQYGFMPLLSSELATSLTSSLTFIIKISDQQSKIFENYLSNKKFFALVTLDTDKKPVHFSNTYQG